MKARKAAVAAVSPAPKLSLAEVATRAGLTVAQLQDVYRQAALEPTFSLEETAKHFGCSYWQVSQLVQLGIKRGAELHPAKGGLWPTFKVSRKCRRVPLSAIERHKRHMERAA